MPEIVGSCSQYVFSGRYKALLVEVRSPNYLKTVCDYVHLNPVRAKLLGAEERLLPPARE